MTPQFLQACISGDLLSATQALGTTVPPSLLRINDILELRLRQLNNDPDFQPWLLRAICLRETNTMIGFIGFHTRPDPQYLHQWLRDAVEFGFEIFSAFRRQGYAREAALALMAWAHTINGVNRFVLTITPQNQPSQALAAKLGFKRIGSHMDVIDGLEDVLAVEYAVVTKK